METFPITSMRKYRSEFPFELELETEIYLLVFELELRRQ